MRRLLTFSTAAVLLLMSLGIGLFTADLPFWRRAIDLPLGEHESFIPTTLIGAPTGGAVEALDPARNSLDLPTLEAVAERARVAGAEAVLVSHRGVLQLERYYAGVDRLPVLQRPADFLARPIAAIAVGLARADERIASLDAPVSTWLTEWEGEPRGAITLRQLLNETSGLETGVDAAQILGSRPFDNLSRLPRFATSRGVRLLLGNDFQQTALSFKLDHEPGGFFNVSPANTQLAAIIVERATGLDYETFLTRRLFQHGWLSTMAAQMDRRSGMPAAHCCVSVSGRSAIQLVEYLRNDGAHDGEYPQIRLWPAGWVPEMLKGSRANPEFGLQLERLTGMGTEVWQLGDRRGGGAWIVPAAELSIVILARRDISTPVDIIAPLLGTAAVRK